MASLGFDGHFLLLSKGSFGLVGADFGFLLAGTSSSDDSELVEATVLLSSTPVLLICFAKQLRDLAIHRLEILYDLSVGLPPAIFDFAVFGTWFMSAFESL